MKHYFSKYKKILVVVLCLLLVMLFIIFIDPIYVGVKSFKALFETKAEDKVLVCDYQEEPKWFDSYRVVAHALGGIDGKTYTNTMDALEYNYASGKRMFEVDFNRSSDGEIILNHDFSETQDNLYDWVDGYVPTMQEFKDNLINYKYEGSNVIELLTFMQQHSDMYLLVDIKYDLDINVVNSIMQQVVDVAKANGMQSVLNRFVVEFYSEDNYYALNAIYPFKHYMYALYAEKNKDFESVKNFCLTNKIDTVLMSYKWVIDPTTIQIFNESNIKVYVYTLNNLTVVFQEMDNGVYGFISDYMKESDLNLKPIVNKNE